MAFKAPKSWPNKVLINFWGGFCFVILASYTANHAAIYAGLSQKPNFDNIFDNEDLLTRKVATIPGTSAEIFIRNINAELHRHMELNSFFNVVSVEDAVDRLKRGSLDALIYDTALLDYVQANNSRCTLKTAGASFGSQGYAVAFPVGFWLKAQISTAILKYMETGFVDDLSAKWFGGLQCKNGPVTIDTLEPRALGLEDFAGVFALLGAGAGVCLIILALEHIVYRMLPWLRQFPRTSIVHSRHVMFFSQKLYRFLNSVDLVSPNSSAKEFASSIKQGQVN
ncbi:putative Glutamate receptor ionotropic, NMDA 3A [Hypsibius exemplaris]|uniref:Glutamate receptor ionotropic, NMDA 3A n=1 Tax=Hypsibius exemplaris TaxID=2072580 RepID=A0A9X6RM48_HYPEX|nr:putative Glutamate receptor ionotropic, NMDA 3A [Hypsibius exemplaris]